MPLPTSVPRIMGPLYVPVPPILILNLRSSKYQSAVTTFDILRNYADIPELTLKNLANLIDDASNGFLLERNAHKDFDSFVWCLQPTEVHLLTLPWNIGSKCHE